MSIRQGLVIPEVRFSEQTKKVLFLLINPQSFYPRQDAQFPCHSLRQSSQFHKMQGQALATSGTRGHQSLISSDRTGALSSPLAASGPAWERDPGHWPIMDEYYQYWPMRAEYYLTRIPVRPLTSLRPPRPATWNGSAETFGELWSILILVTMASQGKLSIEDKVAQMFIVRCVPIIFD